MTELEIMQRAKMYIDKLANGVNPLTGEHVPDNDTINNVRISRCFFYVSDILHQVIDNGGQVGAKKKTKKSNFFITEEQMLDLHTRTTECYVSDIAEEINRVAEGNDTVKMQATWITTWLVNIGMLEIVDGGKAATESGKEIGIRTELRHSMQRGEYLVNLYSTSAQEFIFNNIESVISLRYAEK